MRTKVATLAVVAAFVAVVAGAIAALPDDRDEGRNGSGIELSAASGAFSISNSRAGQAVLAGRGMLPGQSVSGSVRVGNPNDATVAIKLAPRGLPSDMLAKALRLRVADGQGRAVYGGSLAEMPEIAVGSFEAGETRDYQFTVSLPSDAGQALQARSTSVDFVWTAMADEPPPACKLRNIRSRLFVFRRKNVIRLVARYKAGAGGAVTVRFHTRRADGGAGRVVAQMRTRFKATGERWRKRRVALRRRPAEMRRLRHSKHGFVARLRVAGAPGYCAQFLNLELSQRRIVKQQPVWFQRGTFRGR